MSNRKVLHKRSGMPSSLKNPTPMNPTPTIAGLLLIAGMAISAYARSRYIATGPDEMPFTGRQMTPFPGRGLYRSPGFPIFVAGAGLSFVGVIGTVLGLLLG